MFLLVFPKQLTNVAHFQVHVGQNIIQGLHNGHFGDATKRSIPGLHDMDQRSDGINVQLQSKLHVVHKHFSFNRYNLKRHDTARLEVLESDSSADIWDL